MGWFKQGRVAGSGNTAMELMDWLEDHKLNLSYRSSGGPKTSGWVVTIHHGYNMLQFWRPTIPAAIRVARSVVDMLEAED